MTISSQCAEGLVCNIRNFDGVPVPGCTADLTLENDDKTADFCIVREDYNQYQLKFLGTGTAINSIKPLLVCEGDCNSDDDVRLANS